jgi:hypothetical protein
MSDLFRRYVAGELTLDIAGEAIAERSRAEHRGISVDLLNVPAAQHERVLALFGYHAKDLEHATLSELDSRDRPTRERCAVGLRSSRSIRTAHAQWLLT